MENETGNKSAIDSVINSFAGSFALRPKRDQSASWSSLPPELRNDILARILNGATNLSSCAAVCTEWQDFLENSTFSRLDISASDLDDFDKCMNARRRELISHICLAIRVPAYHHLTFSERASPNGSLVREGIWKLFSILSTWEPSKQGLTLELKAESPSDGFHLWYYDPLYENRLRFMAWALGRFVVTIADDGTELPFPQRLPTVNAVTSLDVSQQLHHRFSPKVLQLMLRKLPRVESIFYEPFYTEHRYKQLGYDMIHKSFIEQCLPQTLKRVTLFEHAHPSRHVPADYTRDVPYLGPRVEYDGPAVALAKRSISLEYLSVSVMVDARQFFDACELGWTWHNLQYLELTSPLLTDVETRDEVSDLLYNAGITALNMPQLHNMILWNGMREEAGAFIYCKKSKEDGLPSITWRGTWTPYLHRYVTVTWDVVAETFTRQRIRMDYEWIDGSGINDIMDARVALKLVDLVEPQPGADR
ncbi:hypothetical protein B0T10DRAFT_520287 [Thelonectria olida]|uniref:DUF6546 domain-containing protein n=1 Tax=Thelonectria olida TaxID=1576542 RepID=A0A9P9AKE9_9HYPO|nr:hypothetical protein B0T10DRAFT_520287 [Thelonectria olida]